MTPDQRGRLRSIIDPIAGMMVCSASEFIMDFERSVAGWTPDRVEQAMKGVKMVADEIARFEPAERGGTYY